MTETTPAPVIQAALDGFFLPAAKAKQEKMTDDQTRYFMTFYMADAEKLAQGWTELLEKKDYSGSIIERVSLRFSRPVAPAVKLFFVFLCKSPGDVVMHMAFAHWRMRERRDSALDMATLAEIFPWGFWDAETRERLWDGQKTPDRAGVENLLDSPEVLAWLNTPQEEAAP